VRLIDIDPEFQPPLHVGEVVNVTGTVATRDVGGWEIVAGAEGVLRASLRSCCPDASPTASTALAAEPSPPAAAAGGAPGPDGSAGAADGSGDDPGRPWLAVLAGGLVAAIVATGAGVALWWSRRRTDARPGHDDAEAGPGTHQHA
jgi:hypothetical protein